MKKIFFTLFIILFALSAFAEIPKDLLKKAEKGDAEAQMDIGLMYDLGYVVPQDYKQALEWYLKAANQGNARAQINLGIMYYNGEGVQKDLVTSCAWTYISGDSQNSAYCDNNLNQNQMTRTLKMVDDLKKQIKTK